jgi:hypothetical protein
MVMPFDVTDTYRDRHVRLVATTIQFTIYPEWLGEASDLKNGTLMG